MVAALRNRQSELILNVPSAGALPGMEPGDVVEVPCLVAEGLITPVASPALPPAARGLVAPVKAFEHLTIEAAITGSRRAAVTALTAHPLVGDHPTAASLADGYLRAHERNGSGHAPAEVAR
jgi:6-phospho-beta-glucosidase